MGKQAGGRFWLLAVVFLLLSMLAPVMPIAVAQDGTPEAMVGDEQSVFEETPVLEDSTPEPPSTDSLDEPNTTTFDATQPDYGSSQSDLPTPTPTEAIDTVDASESALDQFGCLPSSDSNCLRFIDITCLNGVASVSYDVKLWSDPGYLEVEIYATDGSHNGLLASGFEVHERSGTGTVQLSSSEFAGEIGFRLAEFNRPTADSASVQCEWSSDVTPPTEPSPSATEPSNTKPADAYRFPRLTIDSLDCSGTVVASIDPPTAGRLFVGVMKKSSPTSAWDTEVAYQEQEAVNDNGAYTFTLPTTVGEAELGTQAFFMISEGEFQGFSTGTQLHEISGCLSGENPKYVHPMQITIDSVNCAGVVTYTVSDGAAPFEWYRGFSIQTTVPGSTALTNDWLRADQPGTFSFETLLRTADYPILIATIAQNGTVTNAVASECVGGGNPSIPPVPSIQVTAQDCWGRFTVEISPGESNYDSIELGFSSSDPNFSWSTSIPFDGSKTYPIVPPNREIPFANFEVTVYLQSSDYQIEKYQSSSFTECNGEAEPPNSQEYGSGTAAWVEDVSCDGTVTFSWIVQSETELFAWLTADDGNGYHQVGRGGSFMANSGFGSKTFEFPLVPGGVNEVTAAVGNSLQSTTCDQTVAGAWQDSTFSIQNVSCSGELTYSIFITQRRGEGVIIRVTDNQTGLSVFDSGLEPFSNGASLPEMLASTFGTFSRNIPVDLTRYNDLTVYVGGMTYQNEGGQPLEYGDSVRLTGCNSVPVTQEPTELPSTPLPSEEVTPISTDELTPEPTTPIVSETPDTPEPIDEITPDPTDEITPVPTDEPTETPIAQDQPIEVQFILCQNDDCTPPHNTGADGFTATWEITPNEAAERNMAIRSFMQSQPEPIIVQALIVGGTASAVTVPFAPGSYTACLLPVLTHPSGATIRLSDGLLCDTVFTGDGSSTEPVAAAPFVVVLEDAPVVTPGVTETPQPTATATAPDGTSTSEPTLPEATSTPTSGASNDQDDKPGTSGTAPGAGNGTTTGLPSTGAGANHGSPVLWLLVAATLLLLTTAQITRIRR